MAITTNLDTLKINYLTQAQYDTALANNQINSNLLYFTPDTSSDTQVTQTSIISNTSDSTLDHNYRLILSGLANDITRTESVYKVDTIKFNPYQARLFLSPSDTAVSPVFRITNSDNYMDWLTAGSNWFNVNGTSTSSATAGIRLSQSGSSPYIEIFDNRSTATGNNTYRLFASGIEKVNNIGTITTSSFTKSSVASGTSLVSLGTFSIPVGSYIVFVSVYFPSMGTGKRVCMDVSGTGVPLNTADVRASSGSTNYLKCQFAITCSAATTITVKGYQNSGSSLNLTVNYQYIRVA